MEVGVEVTNSEEPDEFPMLKHRSRLNNLETSITHFQSEWECASIPQVAVEQPVVLF